MNKLPWSASTGQKISDGEILLKNLRLLDLDDEFDWPAISKNTFAASDTIKNQKQRIQFAEWILYKLFERWNPSDTELKLRPFFPSLEPLQSLNLRTALFRLLSELKKNGVFRKDIFIRKSMLDDCKGPRFEEVLVALSTSVIYKIIAEDDSDTSVVRQLLLGRHSMVSPDISILSMSYRVSLRKRLSRKEDLSQRYRKLGRMLDLKGHEIEQRGDYNLSSERGRTQKGVPQRTITRLTKHLAENWQGDQNWIDILVQSDRFRPQNSLLERPFDEIWHHASNDTLYEVRPHKKESLLEDLEGRVLIQNERLEKWKRIKESLSKDTKCMSQSVPPCVDEIEKTVNSPRQQGQHDTRMLPPRDTKRTVEGNLGQREPLNRFTVEGGRLRLKNAQQISGDFIDATGPTRSFIIAADSELRSASEEISGTSTPSLTIDNDSQDIMSGTDRAVSKSTKVGGIHRHTLDKTSAQQTDLCTTSDRLAALKLISKIDAQTPIARPRLSLAERTRMSMALASPLKELQNEETQTHVAPVRLLPQQEDDILFAANLPSTGGPCRTASLLDRTRHSMSLMSTTSQGRRQSFRPRASKIYPVNQFNSPGREQSLIEPAETSILEEILPDVDADYDTVFKSRPKIALSPRLGPVQDGMLYSPGNMGNYGPGIGLG
ncbi:hypothetical protein MMC11_001992 [Xylographa trunciseda]|nr:hypothetical protein [Xylographa trunciseda]